jgi:hypothetical protein
MAPDGKSITAEWELTQGNDSVRAIEEREKQ